ncbi:MAG: 4-hydroxy-3-methylbut-2-enyl diphosphate reductase [Verrucomicrobia bacterium]|nr:4-hydroxy-3-methylbut-2-enyl diphosphate reductase [Verrucomicrobiota bacterium]
MRILRAKHLGMCFGVKDAIAMAQSSAAQNPEPLTILGDLVHNPTVLEDLRRQGIRFAPLSLEAPQGPVMITAHGTSDHIRALLSHQTSTVLDGTCPLVHHAHQALRALVDTGHYPVVVGVAGHVEVRGLTGDFEEFSVVLTENDFRDMPRRARYGVVAQTTQPIARVTDLVSAMRRHFPDAAVEFRDTVCRPTKQRQQAAEALARICDVVVVIGGRHSNNTRELAATCAGAGARSLRIEQASELRPEWFDQAETVGITAGTSTPDADIEAAEAWLQSLAARRGGSGEQTHEWMGSIPDRFPASSEVTGR